MFFLSKRLRFLFFSLQQTQIIKKRIVVKNTTMRFSFDLNDEMISL